MQVKKNTFSLILMAVLLMVLLLSVAFLFVSLAKNIAVKAEVGAKCEEINKIAQKSDLPLSKESVAFLADEHTRLKNIYSRFLLALVSPLDEEINEEDLDPLQFKERLIQTQKKLREDARINNLLLPASLGFAKYETELTDPTDIPGLIKRLKVLEEIVHLMSLSGLVTINEISFAEENENRSERNTGRGQKKQDEAKNPESPAEPKAVFSDVPVYLRIGCTNTELIKFLYKLRVSQFNFIVDDLDIQLDEENSGRGGLRSKMLNADLAVRAMTLN
ncbi:MAG: hypothetical protein ISS26_03310 [Candidatus Omnitrophica bacterium]|nr:hypothetical protein [Candidatus Omnitrophota bacterium]